MNNPIKQAFSGIVAEEKLKNKTVEAIYTVGRKPNKLKSLAYCRKMTAVATSFLLFFVGGAFFIRLYYAPAATVSIDTNPSLELTLNCFDRVVAVDSYNKESEKLLEQVNVKYEKCDKAVESIVEALVLEGYLLPENLLSVTLQAKNDKKEELLLRELQETANSAVKAHHSKSELEVYAVSSEVLEHAHDLQLSPAKYLAISKLQEIDSGVSVSTCREHSVKELLDMLEENETNHSQTGHNQIKHRKKQGHGHGQGH